jgi:hypothetical protein
VLRASAAAGEERGNEESENGARGIHNALRSASENRRSIKIFFIFAML